MNEMSRPYSMEKWWNGICGRVKLENPEKNLFRLSFVHHETHMSDWDANSGPQWWEVSTYVMELPSSKEHKVIYILYHMECKILALSDS